MSGQSLVCPYDGCDYESPSELGIQQHHKRTHGISLTTKTYKCEFCDNTVEKQRSHVKQYDNVFCSKDCRTRHNAENLSEKRKGEGNPNWQGKHSTDKVEVVCENCGDTYIITRHQRERTERNFCSHDCYGEVLSDEVSGEDNFNWRGGYEPYYGPTWFSQRKGALERDDYECQDCGLTDDENREMYGKGLEVHHITPIRTFEDTADANELTNLITLCTNCHSQREAS